MADLDGRIRRGVRTINRRRVLVRSADAVRAVSLPIVLTAFAVAVVLTLTRLSTAALMVFAVGAAGALVAPLAAILGGGGADRNLHRIDAAVGSGELLTTTWELLGTENPWTTTLAARADALLSSEAATRAYRLSPGARIAALATTAAILTGFTLLPALSGVVEAAYVARQTEFVGTISPTQPEAPPDRTNPEVDELVDELRRLTRRMNDSTADTSTRERVENLIDEIEQTRRDLARGELPGSRDENPGFGEQPGARLSVSPDATEDAIDLLTPLTAADDGVAAPSAGEGAPSSTGSAPADPSRSDRPENAGTATADDGHTDPAEDAIAEARDALDRAGISTSQLDRGEDSEIGQATRPTEVTPPQGTPQPGEGDRPPGEATSDESARGGTTPVEDRYGESAPIAAEPDSAMAELSGLISDDEVYRLLLRELPEVEDTTPPTPTSYTGPEQFAESAVERTRVPPEHRSSVRAFLLEAAAQSERTRSDTPR